MEILGVGPLELLFIFLVALIVLGPKDMKKAGLTLGRFMRKIVTSQGWHEFQQGWRNLRYLPNKLMRDAGLEEDIQSINKTVKEVQNFKPSLGLKGLEEDLRESERDLSSWLSPNTIASPPPPSLDEQDLSPWVTAPGQTPADEAEQPVAKEETAVESPPSEEDPAEKDIQTTQEPGEPSA